MDTVLVLFIEYLAVPPTEPEDWVRDELPVVLLPDITRHEMDLLLSLLYTGSVNIYRGELARIVSLTHLLKLVSIPVAVSEETWSKRRAQRSPLDDSTAYCRAVISYLPAVAGSKSGGELHKRTRPVRPTAATAVATRGTPPNILLSGSLSGGTGGGHIDVRTVGGGRMKVRPLLLPRVETTTVVGISGMNSKILRPQQPQQQQQQQVVIVDPPSGVFLPRHTTFTLCDNSRDEFEVDCLDMTQHHHHPRDNGDDGDDDHDDGGGDDDDNVVVVVGGGDESDIEEIEIFLNGNGEVERMEVCPTIEDREQEEEEEQGGETAAEDGATVHLVDKEGLASRRSGETVQQENCFMTDLGRKYLHTHALI